MEAICLDKIRNLRYVFLITELVPPVPQVRGKGLWLYDKLLNHNPWGGLGRREELFYSNRSQLLEKSRFRKLNASKLESIYQRF